MRAAIWWCTAALALLSGGCMSGPLRDNPGHVAAGGGPTPNPVYIPLGPPAYGAVFEKVIDVVNDYFEIAYSNRYDGRVETHPRVAPGLEQPWKPGNPDYYGRLLASLQTIRHRAVLLIQPADDGGFFVDVKVFREIEDLERPSRANAGAAAFRSDNTLERQFEVVDASVVDSQWVPLGRDVPFEQAILACLAKFDVEVPEAPAPPPSQ
jgi:hypothetical protein